MTTLSAILTMILFQLILIQGGRIGDVDEMKERVFEIKIITVFNTVLTFFVLVFACGFAKLKHNDMRNREVLQLNSMSRA